MSADHDRPHGLIALRANGGHPPERTIEDVCEMIERLDAKVDARCTQTDEKVDSRCDHIVKLLQDAYSWRVRIAALTPVVPIWIAAISLVGILAALILRAH